MTPTQSQIDVLSIYLILAGLGLLLMAGQSRHRLLPLLTYLVIVAFGVLGILYGPVLFNFMIPLAPLESS